MLGGYNVKPLIDLLGCGTCGAVAAEGLGFSPLEVALAWVRDAPGVTTSLIGARTGAQLRGVLKSEEISLPDIVRSALDEISL